MLFWGHYITNVRLLNFFLCIYSAGHSASLSGRKRITLINKKPLTKWNTEIYLLYLLIFKIVVLEKYHFCSEHITRGVHWDGEAAGQFRTTKNSCERTIIYEALCTKKSCWLTLFNAGSCSNNSMWQSTWCKLGFIHDS